MNILVLPPRYTPDSIVMSQAAARLDWQVERLSSWQVPPELRGKGAAIYGEPLFVTVVAGPLEVEVLEPTADWLPSLPDEHRKRRVQLTTLADARKVTESAFIKPVADKCFAAGVYQSGTELPLSSVLDDKELVLIAEPVQWQIEFRAFVMNGRVLTLSPYLRNGEMAEDVNGDWTADAEELAAAERYCRLVLEDDRLQVPPAVVLDVGLIAGRGWAVVEANAAWGSGLYGCNPEMALRVVRRSCIPRGSVESHDIPWISKERSAESR